MFLLVKGNYQGVTKKSKGKTQVEISKRTFLQLYKQLVKKEGPDDQLTYGQAKAEAKDYAKASGCFYSAFGDWLRLDWAKYYNFH